MRLARKPVFGALFSSSDAARHRSCASVSLPAQSRARVDAAFATDSDGGDLNALVPLPRHLERFVALPKTSTGTRFIALESIVELFLGRLFPGYTLEARGCFAIFRDSDIEVEEEAEDLVRVYETAIKRRRRGSVIRLKVDNRLPEEIIQFLSRELKLNEHSVIVVDGFVGLSDVDQLIVQERRELLFPTVSCAVSRNGSAKWAAIVSRRFDKRYCRSSSIRKFRCRRAIR